MHTNDTKYLLNRLIDYTNEGTIPQHYSGALEEALNAIDENARLRVYAPLSTSDDAQGQTEMVVDADYFNQLRAENARLRAAIDRNINNALTIANYADDEIVTEMAENIVNDLGKAYGIGDEA